MAIGLEYVRRKDIAGASRMLDSIRAKISSMTAAKSTSSATTRYTSVSQGDIDTVSVMENILAAAIRFASGEKEEALKEIRAAAETEDRLVFEYGPPAIVKPAWEAAGELLMEAGRKSEAADAFRRTLKRYPNRRLSNEGLKAATAR
jgi:predicted Zn-dependent protease